MKCCWLCDHAVITHQDSLFHRVLFGHVMYEKWGENQIVGVLDVSEKMDWHWKAVSLLPSKMLSSLSVASTLHLDVLKNCWRQSGILSMFTILAIAYYYRKEYTEHRAVHRDLQNSPCCHSEHCLALVTVSYAMVV